MRESRGQLPEYIADIGAVAYVAIAILGGVVVIGEIAYPGIAVNHLSPQVLVVAAIVSAVTANVVPEKRTTLFGRILYWVLALFTVAAAYKGASGYFMDVPELTMKMSVAAAFTAALTFLVFGIKKKPPNQL